MARGYHLKIILDIVRDILDADERPRYKANDDWWILIFRIPAESNDPL
ncbi:MAG: hypothetical protein LBR18_06475 [Tannerella sp.]|nr:hypothetical protein [Tannerella sp.]